MRENGVSQYEAEQAQAALLRCFTDAVGADTGAVVARAGAGLERATAPSLRTLLGRSGDGEGDRIVTTWSRDGGRVPLSWIDGSLLARGLHADRPIVEIGDRVPFRVGYGAPLSDGLVAPIRLGPRAIGVIYAGFSSTPDADPDDLAWIAESFAATAALCLGDRGSLASTLRASSFDGLTGCLSPSGVLYALDAEIARSERFGHHLSCCFVDLDGFKAVNDRHGHLEGNRLLVAAGSALRSVARRYDSVGRFGGDEFVAVLPQTDLRGAVRLAERMSARVTNRLAADCDVPVHASIGVAEWAGGMLPRELIDAADAALRDAKNLGTGQVVAAGGRANGGRANGRAIRARAGLGRLARRRIRDRNGNGGEPEDAYRDIAEGDDAGSRQVREDGRGAGG